MNEKRPLPDAASAGSDRPAKRARLDDREAPTDKEEKRPNKPESMDVDSGGERPLETQSLDELHFSFDIDECIAVAIDENPPLSPQASQVLELFRKNNLCIDALKLHLILPGVIELIKLLDSMPNARMHFFSGGIKERNELFVKKLLCLALGEARYEVIKSRVIIKSRADLRRFTDKEKDEQYKKDGFQRGECFKDLTLVVGNKKTENTAHLDDDTSYAYGDEIKSFLHTPTCSNLSIILAYGNFKESKFTLLESYLPQINSIFYATGVLFSALDLLKQEKISVAEALTRIQYTKDPADAKSNFKYPYERFFKKYSNYGLEILRRRNPKLNFIDKEHFLSEEPMKTHALQTSTGAIAASLPLLPNPHPMDVDSGGAAQPADVKSSKIFVSLDIDNCIALAIHHKLGEETLDLFKKNNLHIENAPRASFFHLILPGTIELIKLLDRMANVTICFFSSGSKGRNEFLVEKLLCRALGEKRYEEIKPNIIIKSYADLKPKDPEHSKKQFEKYGFHQDDSIKDLMLIDSKQIDNIIHIDNNEKRAHPIENCLRVPSCDAGVPERMHALFVTSEDQLIAECFPSMNTVFYATETLFSVIALAEQKKISVKDALTEIQYEKNPATSTMRFKEELYKNKETYLKGLNRLREMNPKLELADEKTFLGVKTVLEDFKQNVSEQIRTQKESLFQACLNQLIDEQPKEEIQKIRDEIRQKTNLSDKAKKIIAKVEEVFNKKEFLDDVEKKTVEAMMKLYHERMAKIRGNKATQDPPEKPKSPAPVPGK